MLREALHPLVTVAGSEIALIQDDVFATCKGDVVLARGVVGDVIPAQGPPEFERMPASCPAQVIVELVAGYISPLGKRIVDVSDPVGRVAYDIPVAAGSVAFRDQYEWDRLSQRLGIGVGEDRPVVAGREDELVGERWRESMGLVQLPFIRRLGTLRVEDRVDKAGGCRLSPVVYLEVYKQVIVGSQVEIGAAQNLPFGAKICGLSVVDPGVGVVGILHAGGVVPGIVVKVEHALIQRNLDRVAVRRQVSVGRIHIGGGNRVENRSLIRRAGSIHSSALRDNDTKAFGIHKEEHLVLLDWSSHGGRPLVGVDKAPRRSGLLVEEAVRVHGAAIPPVDGVPVEAVAAGA